MHPQSPSCSTPLEDDGGSPQKEIHAVWFLPDSSRRHIKNCLLVRAVVACVSGAAFWSCDAALTIAIPRPGIRLSQTACASHGIGLGGQSSFMAGQKGPSKQHCCTQRLASLDAPGVEWPVCDDIKQKSKHDLGVDVFTTCVGDKRLRQRLSQLCLSLARCQEGVVISNAGGFHSKDLITSKVEALLELKSLLHRPLANFMHQQNWAHAPEMTTDFMCVVACVEKLWANVNGPGHSNKRHNHGVPTREKVASGVYYPQEMYEETAPFRAFLKNGSAVEIVPEAGLLMLFPTDMDHEVVPVPSSGSVRVSLAFNLYVRWLHHPLLRSSMTVDEAEVQRLVLQGAKVEEVDPVLGRQSLHMAAEAGHLPVVDTLVRLGADAAAKSSDNETPLRLAAYFGHVPVTKYLLGSDNMAEGAYDCDDVHRMWQAIRGNHFQDRLCTAGRAAAKYAYIRAEEKERQNIMDLIAAAAGSDLQQAVAAGQVTVVANLLKHGANPQGSWRDTRRPLFDAVGRGHVQVVALLVAARARVLGSDAKGRNVVHIAATYGHLSVLEALTRDCLDEVREAISVADQDGLGPLQLAAGFGHSSIVSKLAALGADLQTEPESLQPPLLLAASSGHTEVVQTLLNLRAHPESASSQSKQGLRGSERWKDAIAVRAFDHQRHGAISQRLDRYNIKVRMSNLSLGREALHASARAGHLAVTDLLMSYGASVNSRDCDGGSPLHWAASSGHCDLVDLLLAAAADPNAADHSGCQPLHEAAWDGHLPAAAKLLDAGAVAKMCSNDFTALHAAAAAGHLGVAEQLLSRGAKATAKAGGVLPADLSQEGDLKEVLRRAAFGQTLLESPWDAVRSWFNV
eukprot:TRINITY_DN79821_c0_g1_i1.p1 TRINITY_DN79821_c0_g1~~TRINITY_DN79821_c0_g1_i1.p1  ORF type:complete len:853 (+),score=130.31 TRINITY_DN79821_c0_g1_i1:87-2645(+)